ncbi:MAG: glycosyl hydrolase family 18 protein [Erysipelotrichales bacterium]|nr:glycosyl hydrolase family 18 protein [Erysipelotrichales bacterium]
MILDAISKDLQELFNNKLVKSNIVFPIKDEKTGARIEWQSSKPEILSASGEFKRDYIAHEIILTANLYHNGSNKTVEFKVISEGYKSLTKSIASSYIYTNYEIADQEYFETMEIIFAAFALADKKGNLLQHPSTINCLENISKYLKAGASKHGCWLILSIGGGGQSDEFVDIAATQESRVLFSKNVVELLNQYQLDGIDIDWETPTLEQAPTFTLLMEELYKQIKANNPHHLLTTPITGGRWQPPCYDLFNAIKYIDYVNMMTYGMTNNQRQYHNALYPSTKNRTLETCSIDESVKIFNDLGVPNHKLIAGLAYYGMSQLKDENEKWVGDKSFSYTQIKENLDQGTFIEYYDVECEQPYALDSNNQIFVSYDSPRSIIAKCQYVERKGLAGVMYWQHGQDKTGELTRAIRKSFKFK